MADPRRIQRRVVFLFGVCVVTCAMAARPSAQSRPAATAVTDDALERLERSAFDYLWQQRDARSGLVYNTTEPRAPASQAAAGVALSAIPIGIERGWISREAGYRQAHRLVRSLNHSAREHGFFYHFIDSRTGRRVWGSEVSCMDSAIVFAGAAVVAEYFRDTEVARLANQLIDRAVWPWFLDGEDTLKWGWKPETGFEGGPMEFSESVLAYLLAIGSPTHPLPPSSWSAMRRPITRVLNGQRSMVYTDDGSLFAYLLPLLWFDLRARHDAYLDYWSNAQVAILSNLQFCLTHAGQFRTYREGLWGLSAALGPDGYTAYGAMPARHVVHDGTVAPYVVAASIPFIPDIALQTLQRMEQLSPSVWTRYGFGDALNLDRRYACAHTIALDQGMILLMVENLRSGLVWELFMRHPVARQAMALAGFVPGSLTEPVVPPVIPGNPGASMTVPMIDHAVAIDGDLREWIRREGVELTPTDRRHVEFGFFTSARDASALIYLGWTHEAFYVAGIVTDDALVTRQRGERIYQDDCLELYWDLDGDGFRFDGNPHDVQIGLAPGGSDGAWQLWAWGALKRIPQEIQAALKREDGRFVFELAIPMTLLPGVVPGHPVRFSVAYHDRDPDGKAGKLHWSVDTASMPGELFFGQMTLSPEP